MKHMEDKKIKEIIRLKILRRIKTAVGYSKNRFDMLFEMIGKKNYLLGLKKNGYTVAQKITGYFRTSFAARKFFAKKNNLIYPSRPDVFNVVRKAAKRTNYYLKIWYAMSKNSFKGFIIKKNVFFIFLTGKLLRLFFFLGFLFFLVSGTKELAGYNLHQTIFFYLTYVLIDTLSQLFFREVYRFRPLVINGDLDLIMVKPYKTIFRVLMGGADVADLLTIPIIVGLIIFVSGNIQPQVGDVFLYILLLVSSMVISASFHIFVLAMGIITYEIDHSVMIYRDFTRLATLPVDIYKEPLRSFITYVIPVGLMMTFPAKVFLNVFSGKWVLFSFAISSALLFLSIRFWNFSLKKYTSASS